MPGGVGKIELLTKHEIAVTPRDFSYRPIRQNSGGKLPNN